MPLSRHYKGEGSSIARKMRKLYGKDWKRVFYATEHKLGIKNPGELDKHEELTEEEHAAIAIFHLAHLEECLERQDDPELDEAKGLVEESLDNLVDALESLDVTEDNEIESEAEYD